MKKRLLYLCSFVPYLGLSALGFDMISIHDAEQKNNNYSKKHSISNKPTDIGNNHTEEIKPARISGNPCCFIKYCERINYSEYDGVIFTNCCNSTQRLYDYVKYKYQNIFTYLLEIPRLEGQPWNIYNLMREINLYFHTSITLIRQHIKDDIHEMYDNEILIISTALNKKYVQELQNIFSEHKLMLETCPEKPRGDLTIQGAADISCPRMMNYYSYIQDKIKRAKAVIYITIQKCDYTMFAYPAIKQFCELNNKKCLLVEEEYTRTLSENSKIRYDAFKECLEIGSRIIKDVRK